MDGIRAYEPPETGPLVPAEVKDYLEMLAHFNDPVGAAKFINRTPSRMARFRADEPAFDAQCEAAGEAYELKMRRAEIALMVQAGAGSDMALQAILRMAFPWLSAPDASWAQQLVRPSDVHSVAPEWAQPTIRHSWEVAT